ncbi:MAG TPA: hypothetical protein VG013_08910 [Gemmataceae bacterium]|nr:hypothetical protein [Gemmataceae bacterium]
MVVEKWYPVSQDFGLIQAPMDQVVDGLLAWHRSIGFAYERRDIATCLADAFDALPPLSADGQRKLFVRTASDWVAFYQSGIQGSDPFPVMSYLAQRLGVLAMRVCSTGAPWPATMWEVYAPEALGGTPPLGYRRAIAASNDGGRWVFHQSGTSYEFEQAARYGMPRKRDRFTRAMLCEYLKHFGIEAFADDFLRVGSEAPAIWLQRTQPVSRQPGFSLAEVVAGVPWRKK